MSVRVRMDYVFVLERVKEWKIKQEGLRVYAEREKSRECICVLVRKSMDYLCV